MTTYLAGGGLLALGIVLGWFARGSRFFYSTPEDKYLRTVARELKGIRDDVSKLGGKR
jgi:hypothetical protein